MFCTNAEYINFRNIKSERLEFSSDVNIIYGDNAQGKTNALEGLYLHAGCRSHRAARDRDMIAFGSDFTKVKIGVLQNNQNSQITQHEREVELDITLSSSGRRICRKNGLFVKRASDYIGNFRAVLFTPEHLSIIKDGPSERRAFIDGALCQLSSAYLSHMQDYNRVLMQRNKLLSAISDGGVDIKSAKVNEVNEVNLAVWTEKLAEESEIISKMREKYTQKLSELVGDIFNDMTSGKERVEIKYSGAKTKDELLEQFKNARAKEFALGSTLYGVHRDDLEIMLNRSSVRSFGSQGQQRSVSLAMKLAEGEISKLSTGEYPVFLFDDILSELDRGRKEYIMSGISGRQVIITACTKEDLFDGANIIYCKNGRYGG